MKALPWILAVVVPLSSLPFIFTYLNAGCWDCTLLRSHRHRAGERPQSGMLKTLAAAQADFRANDRDGDGIQQFWREDVAGLFSLPGVDGSSLELIERSTALADDFWVVCPGDLSAPKGGYWVRVLRHADETPGALDPNRYAFCAYPAAYSPTSRYVFIIDEGNTVFRGDLGQAGPPDVFPDEATLKAKWSKLD